MSTTTLLVRQDQLATTRLQTTEDTALADGQVRVRVDQFALTANNITYAAMGDLLNYWQFFPTGEPGWGIVPVWGFGTVVQSLHPAIAVGERLYGYWPLASQAVLSVVSRPIGKPSLKPTCRAQPSTSGSGVNGMFLLLRVNSAGSFAFAVFGSGLRALSSVAGSPHCTTKLSCDRLMLSPFQ